MNQGNERRRFLKSSAASLFLAGFLSRFEGFAQAQRKVNLFLFYTPNGFDVDSFGTQGTGSSFTFLPSMRPIEQAGHKGDVTVISGLKCSHGAISHERVVSLLTGVNGVGGRFDQRGGAPSLEWYLKQQLKLPAPLHVRVPEEESKGYLLHWEGREKPAPVIVSPYQALATLMGGVTAPKGDVPTDTSMANLHARGKRINDLLVEDAKDIKKRILGVDERAALDDYLTHLEETEEQAMQSGMVPAAVCQKFAIEERFDPESKAAWRKIVNAHVDVVIHSFLCSRRLASLDWGFAVDGLNVANPAGKDLHNHSHYFEGKGSRSEYIESNRLHAESYASILKKMKDTKLPSGETLLADSMVVWFSEIPGGGNHGNDNYIVTVGGQGGGKIRTGQALDAKEAELNKVWVAVQQAMGVQSDRYGSTVGSLPGLLA